MTFRRLILISGFLVLGFAVHAVAWAEGPMDQDSSDSEDALHKTRQLLTTPGQREQAIQGDDRARQADSQVNQLTGGNAALKERVYGVSAGAMSDLTRASGGNPEDMSRVLEKAQQDPEGFLKSLSPETQQQIKSLARDIEEQQKQQRQPH